MREKHLIWSKLAGVCTDGAPSMRGKEKDLVGLMNKRDEMSMHHPTGVTFIIALKL